MPLSIGIGISTTKLSDSVSALFSGMPSPTWALDFVNDEYSTLSPALTVSSPTGGVMVPDYLGNYHLALAGEMALRGGRRVRNVLTAPTGTAAGLTGLLNATTSGDTITETATSGTHGAYRQESGLAAGRYFGQAKIKAGAATQAFFELNGFGSSTYFGIDLTDGTTFGTVGAITNISVSDEGDGWYLVSASHERATTGTGGIGVYIGKNDSVSYAGDGSLSVRVKDLMLERVPADRTACSEYISRGVLSAPYHGYGVDGLAWMRTDPSGLALADGLGPELVTNGGFDTDTGWTHGANITIGGGAAEFAAFDVLSQSTSGFIAGRQYLVSLNFVQISGTAQPLVRLGQNLSNDESISSGTGPKVVTVTAGGTGASLYLRFNGSGSFSIDNISVREVYPVPCTGIADWPTLTNRLNYNQDASQWTKRGVATCTLADDGTVEGGYFELRGLGNRAIDDVYRICSGFAADEDAAPALLIRPVDTAGTLRLFNPQNANNGTWEVDLSALAVGRWNFVNLGHSAVTVVNAFSASGTAAGLHFAAVDGTGPIDVDVAVPTLIGGTLNCPVVIPTAATAVTANAIVKTLDKDEIGYVAGGGTWVIEHTPELPVGVEASNQYLLSLVGPAGDAAFLYNWGGDVGAFVLDDSVMQWSAGDAAAVWEVGTTQRIAWRLEENDGSLVTDGAERVSDTNMTVPGVSTIYLCGTSSSKYAGSIGAIAYYAAGA